LHDGKHYSNRFVGNSIHRSPGFDLRTEATLCPTPIANNTVLDVEPGVVWFPYGLLAESRACPRAVSQTVITRNGARFAGKGEDR